MMNSATIASDALSLSVWCMDWCLLLPRVCHQILPLASDAPTDIVRCPSEQSSPLFLRDPCVRLGSILCCFKSLVWGVDHPDRTIAKVQATFAPNWTTKQTLANTLVQFGCVDHQTPKSKLDGPGVHFPYNLSLFGDWWQHDQSKQIIINTKRKTYLLTRMQCKGKFIWC
jgi:hypothetical protein